MARLVISLLAAALLTAAALTAPGCDSGPDADEPGFRVLWTAPTNESGTVWTTPLVDGPRTFGIRNQQLVAFDSHAGEHLWTSPLPVAAGGASGNMLHDPVPDGLLYIHDVHWAAAVRKRDGVVVWTTPLPTRMYTGTRSMAQTTSHLFIGRANEVVRIRKGTGAIDLRLDISDLSPEGIEHQPRDLVVAPGSGTLYVGTAYYVPGAPDTEGYVMAFSAASGDRMWVYEVPHRTRTLAPGHVVRIGSGVNGVDVSGNAVVFGTSGGVWGLHPRSGMLLWEEEFEDDGFINGVTVADGAVYAGSTQQRVYKLDIATGERRWAARVRGTVATPIAVERGRAYTVTMTNELFVLDTATGEVLWSGTPNRNEAFISPVGVGDGVMVAVEVRKVYAMRSP